MAASRIKGITVEISGDVTKLNTALDSVNRAVKSTQSQLKDVEKLLKLDPGNTQLLNQRFKLLNQAVEETKTKLKSLQEANAQVTKNLGNYDAWKAKFDPIKQKIDETKTKISELKAKMKELESEGKVNTEGYRKLQDELKETKKVLSDLNQEKKAVDEEFGHPISPEQYDALQREIVETEQDLKKLEQQAEKAGDALKSIAQKGENLKNIGTTMTDIGYAIEPVSNAAQNFLSDVVEVSGDFEHQMDRVRAITGATGAEFDKMTESAKKMSSGTIYSANEVAAGMEYMGMAGWNATQIMTGLPAVLDLAATSGEEFGAVSDIVTDDLTAFGLAAEDAAMFADVLAATATSTNTNVSKMGQTFKYCAPVAGALGYSLQDTAVAAGLMANVGIKSSQAGTSMRMIFQHLTKDITLTGQAFGELTVRTQNADGTMRPLSDVLVDLRGAFNQMTEAEKVNAAQSLVGTRAMSGFLGIINTSDEDFNRVTQSINDCNGAAREMAEIATDNYEGSLKKFNNAVDELRISFGEILLPILKVALDVATKIINFINELPAPIKSVVLVIAGLVAALGPLLIYGGRLLYGIGQILTVWPQISGILSGLSGVFGLLKSGIMSVVSGIGSFISSLVAALGPIGLIVLAIAAVVTVFVLLWQNCEGFRNFFIDLGKKLAESFKKLGSNIKKGFEDFGDSFLQFCGMVYDGWNKLGDKTKAGIDKANAWLDAKSKAMVASLSKDWESCKNKLTEIGNTIHTNVSNAFDKMGTHLLEVAKQNRQELGEIWDATYQYLNNGAADFINVMKEGWTVFKDFLFTNGKKIYTDAVTWWNNTRAKLQELDNIIFENASSAWSTISGTVASKAYAAYEAVSSWWSSMQSDVSEKAWGIYGDVKTAMENLGAYLSGLGDRAIQWGADMINGFKRGVDSALGGLEARISSTASRIRSYLHFSRPDIGPLRDYESWMPDFMKGLAKGIQSNEGVVERAVSGVANIMSGMNGGIAVNGPALAGASAKGTATMRHTGTIRVEGVNDSGEMTGIVDIIIDQLRQEVRL